MLDDIKAYECWAPKGAPWSEWVKPVLFMNPPKSERELPPPPDCSWAPDANQRTMLIIDLPGDQGVHLGLALAARGYQPVPLYNCVRPPHDGKAAVETYFIAYALNRGAQLLSAHGHAKDAPPAFLLDENRMAAGAKPAGMFDNRWCVFPQDMPSAALLKGRGIERAVVYANTIADDLKHILRRYQDAGIPIEQKRDGEAPEPIVIQRPSQFGRLRYRAQVIFGLKRNATGGFGDYVPTPVEGGGGTYYRMG